MKTSIASPGCKDFDEPTYPEAAGIYVIIDWFRRRKERKRREKRAMQVYDAKGCAKDVPEPQNKVRFRDLEKGDVFKQSGRILIKTNPISIIDRFDPLGHDGQVNMKRFNAVQLTGKQGSKSCISDDTMVERFPNAAIYLRG